MNKRSASSVESQNAGRLINLLEKRIKSVEETMHKEKVETVEEIELIREEIKLVTMTIEPCRRLLETR